MRKLSVVLLVVAMGLTSAPAGASSTLVKSSFGSDNDGWKFKTNSYTPSFTPATWLNSDNDPPECLEYEEASASNLIVLWKAPSKFRGDKSAAFNGTLSFDYRFGRYPEYPNLDLFVFLRGADSTILQYSLPGSVSGTDGWTSLVVPLTKTGWVNAANMVPVTKAKMKAVLGALSLLEIQSHDSIGASSFSFYYLDNVKLSKPI